MLEKFILILKQNYYNLNIKPSIKVLIFDFDGVIVDSNHIKDKAFKIIFKEYPEHYQNLMNYHFKNVSKSRVFKFDYLLKLINKEKNYKLKKELMKKFSTITIDLMKSVPFVNGFKKLVEKFKDLPLYLISVTPIEDLEIILNNLSISNIFKKTYGCPPWNKISAINEILIFEKIKPNEAIMIGDSIGDQIASKKTKINFIGRYSGLPFDKPSPKIFKDLNSISKYLKRKI